MLTRGLAQGLILFVVTLLCSCGSAEYRELEYKVPKTFFSELNTYGERLDHEVLLLNGLTTKGTKLSCDMKVCRWLNAQMLADSLVVDSILAIRFHSRRDAFERSFYSYVRPGFITGLGFGALTTAFFLSFENQSTDGSDALGYLLGVTAAGAALGATSGLAAIAIDGLRIDDPGYMTFIFRDKDLTISRLRSRDSEHVNRRH